MDLFLFWLIFLNLAIKIRDIGILASVDPVAIDRASLDLIKKNVDVGTNDLLGQIKRLKGENTVDVAEKIGVGTQDYNLIYVDGDVNDEEGNLNNNKSFGLNFWMVINLILMLLIL